MAGARSLLDRVHTLAQIEAFDPEAYREALREDLAEPATFEGRDTAARDALLAIEATIVRVMKAKLEHALANNAGIPAQTRAVFASTVVAYGADLELLRTRVRDIAARGHDVDPYGAADRAVEVARETLALRQELFAAVFDLIREVATTERPAADLAARDRKLEDAPRKKWSALRRELDAIVDDPTRIVAAPFAKRLAEHADQIDEPDPEAEPSFADLIELD